MKTLVFTCFITICLLWDSTTLLSFTNEQIAHEKILSELAKDRCNTEQIEGSNYSVKVLGDGKLEVSFFGKKGGNLQGTFIYNKNEWEGRQRVLQEHQARENADRRECIKEELESLRSSYKPPANTTTNSISKIITISSRVDLGMPSTEIISLLQKGAPDCLKTFNIYSMLNDHSVQSSKEELLKYANRLASYDYPKRLNRLNDKICKYSQQKHTKALQLKNDIMNSLEKGSYKYNTSDCTPIVFNLAEFKACNEILSILSNAVEEINYYKSGSDDAEEIWHVALSILEDEPADENK